MKIRNRLAKKLIFFPPTLRQEEKNYTKKKKKKGEKKVQTYINFNVLTCSFLFVAWFGLVCIEHINWHKQHVAFINWNEKEKKNKINFQKKNIENNITKLTKKGDKIQYYKINKF